MGIVLNSRRESVVPAVNPILSGEGNIHQRAKQRLYDLIKATGPEIIEKEYDYPNPFDAEFPGALTFMLNSGMAEKSQLNWMARSDTHQTLP